MNQVERVQAIKWNLIHYIFKLNNHRFKIKSICETPTIS